MSRNLSSLSSRRGLDDGLFERLRAVAPEDNKALETVAEDFLVGGATTLGAHSFYDFLGGPEAGKTAHVCNGTSCWMAGTQKKLREDLGGLLKDDEIGEVCCLGRCHENAAFQYKGETRSGAKGIAAVDEASSTPNRNRYAVGTNLETPMLTEPFPGVEAYYEDLSELTARSPEALLADLAESKLRGRGGAGFPAAVKWEACAQAEGAEKFVVCNGDEGDPGAFSDQYLLEEQCHRVLLGMMLTGYMVGAETGILYVRTEYPEAVRRVRAAVREMEAAGLLGENIRGPGVTFRFKVIEGAGSYVIGEETALLASIEGQRPEVRVRPPYPVSEGLFLQPTIVSNVETFANLPQIAREGGTAFAALGTAESTGSKLVSLDGRFRRPGVYEVAMGTPLTEIFEDLGGGFSEALKAVQVGGPLGGVVPVSFFPQLTVDFESFAQAGFLLGHGSVVGIPERVPMVDLIEHLFAFTARESCGKCFPCRIGATRGQELFAQVKDSGSPVDATLLNDLLETLECASLCALGGGVPLPIRNVLEYFESELRPFIAKEGLS
jgi:NADH:ubiquinone oxidoreductase subunit F (NADH-binding)